MQTEETIGTPGRQNAIQFDPKDRSASLTYEELARTMRIGDSMGNMPKQIPMQPGELIMHIIGLIKKYTGREIIAQPVIVREPYLQTNLNKTRTGEPLELEDYLVRRFVTKFEVDLTHREYTPDQMHACVALTYAYTDSVKGMQVAFGENVSACDNLVAFGQYHFSTYGNDRCTFDEGMQLLTHWCMNMRTIHEKYGEVVQYLKEFDVDKEQFQRIIGSLFEKAVRVNNGEKGVVAPLNQSQVAAMVAAGLETLKAQEGGVMGEYMNAWDILSWGTSTLKAQTSDMIELLKSTTQFNDFIYREFGCEVVLAI